ncbi:hypothetical protein PoB_005013600 [Plakobranchus ocellatus]|uniref:Uncharacterized protein n=1 Tax=Plakobranchus ocellatus TaxID=259542 RepID=A0AAV4BT46_9GAST|nr:hypothetical protein PoB_005013600 [Plakobranchus ocellatus]
MNLCLNFSVQAMTQGVGGFSSHLVPGLIQHIGTGQGGPSPVSGTIAKGSNRRNLQGAGSGTSKGQNPTRAAQISTASSRECPKLQVQSKAVSSVISLGA